MDFTYRLAAISAVMIGFFASFLFVLQGRGSKFRLIAVTFAASLALDGAGLINWAHIETLAPSFLALDFTLIAAYTAVGGLVGVARALALSTLWQWMAQAARGAAG